MNRSGIIYQDQVPQEVESSTGFESNGELFEAKIGSVNTQNPDLFTSHESGYEQEYSADLNNDNKLNVFEPVNGEMADASESYIIEHKEFIADSYTKNDRDKEPLSKVLDKMQKSPMRAESDNSRKFTLSGDPGLNKRDKDPEIKNYNTPQPGGMRMSLVSDTESDSQITTSNTSMKKTDSNLPAKKNKKELTKTDKKTKESSNQKKDRSESALISFMFIFEIFRWFTSTDVIVRFILGAVAGVLGFGLIFSQMGFLSNQ